jgi:hypothetical protein
MNDREIAGGFWNDDDGTWFEFKGELMGPYPAEREAEEAYEELKAGEDTVDGPGFGHASVYNLFRG